MKVIIRVEFDLYLIAQFLNFGVDALRPAGQDVTKVTDLNRFAFQILDQIFPYRRCHGGLIEGLRKS